MKRRDQDIQERFEIIEHAIERAKKLKKKFSGTKIIYSQASNQKQGFYFVATNPSVIRTWEKEIKF